MDEIFHGHGAVDVAGIEAKEDACEGRESAHQVCFESDRCLNPINIGWDS